MRYRFCLLTLVISVCLGGCRSSQSVLSPRGEEAERVAFLASILFTGAALIFAGVMAIALIAALGRGSLRRMFSTDRLVVWGGLSSAFPSLQHRGLVLCRDLDAPLAEIDSALAAGQPVVVEIEA